MKKKIPELIIILLLITVSLCGVLSLDFSNAWSYINQYGDEVKLFGSGIYKDDSYFKAPIFIGSDLCVLFFLVPLFVISVIKDLRASTAKTQLRLVSIEAISLYYAVSLCIGVKCQHCKNSVTSCLNRSNKSVLCCKLVHWCKI